LVKADENNLVKRLNQLKCSGLFRLQLNIDNIDIDMVVVCFDKIQIHNELNRLVGKHTHLKCSYNPSLYSSTSNNKKLNTYSAERKVVDQKTKPKIDIKIYYLVSITVWRVCIVCTLV